MQLIKDMEFGGERPLFGSRDLHLDHVTVRAGESAIKECSNIIATNCRFEGNYPFGTCTVSSSTAVSSTWEDAPPCGIPTI